MNLLGTQISYVENYNYLPRPIELGKVFQAIDNPTKTKPLIQQIREVEAVRQSYLMHGDTQGAKAVKDTQKAPLKAKLPAFIFGAICEGGHRAEHIILKTGIVCLDFDSDLSTSPAQWEAFRDNLINVKYVFYSALSVSGSGVMALLQIPDPDRQSENFEQMKVDFAGLLQKFNVIGAKLDISKGGNPAQLRFLTYDPDAKFKPDYRVYDRLPKKKPKTKPVDKQSTPTTNQTSDVFEYCRALVNDKGCSFKHGSDMHYSIYWLCRYLNEFGVSRRDAENWIDSNVFSLSKIKSNCISYPYLNFKHDHGIQSFEIPNPTPELIDTSTGEVFDYPPDWDEVAEPDEGTAEYNEMIRLIESEFDAVIDHSVSPEEIEASWIARDNQTPFKAWND